jgi:sugar/nucleoside kinase (ribokinase family)
MQMNGLFMGLATLDLIYLTQHFPDKNEKIVALAQTLAAGGPATNAAVTFGYLGDRAHLLTVVGSHPLSQLIRADLETQKVHLLDLDAGRTESPPVSSILVTQATGERAVISLNATKAQAQHSQLPADILEGIDIVLIDGHQLEISQAIAQQAKSQEIPVVFDGGSWKPGCDRILPSVDYAICSANFYPPTCQTQADVFTYLQNLGIPNIAITQGERPILYLIEGQLAQLKIPPIKAVDTLGAGDIFHGAFCYYILRINFPESLESAAKIASYSCQYFGTRQWLDSRQQGTGNRERGTGNSPSPCH